MCLLEQWQTANLGGLRKENIWILPTDRVKKMKAELFRVGVIMDVWSVSSISLLRNYSL